MDICQFRMSIQCIQRQQKYMSDSSLVYSVYCRIEKKKALFLIYCLMFSFLSIMSRAVRKTIKPITHKNLPSFINKQNIRARSVLLSLSSRPLINASVCLHSDRHYILIKQTNLRPNSHLRYHIHSCYVTTIHPLSSTNK